MTLSIEVLPAPFGPMMARISPLRMSKETSRDRLHAAEGERDVLDREHRLAGRDVGARIGALTPAFSIAFAGTGYGLHVADRDARGDRALAAVLEGHLGRDVGLLASRHRAP